MHPTDLLDQLVDLARKAGLEVREIARAPAGEGASQAGSGTCRLRGRVWVMLAASDSADERIDVLGKALATHAPDFLEARYLPPALRARLTGAPDPA